MSEIKERHRIRIEASFAPYGTKVWLDDKELYGVRNIEFKHPAGSAPEVIIHLFPEGVELSVDGNITFSEDGAQEWIKDHLETMEWMRQSELQT